MAEQIDPQQFGRMSATIEHLQAQMERHSQEMRDLRTELREMKDLLEHARGGWRIVLAIGAVAAALGAIVAKLVDWWIALRV